VARLSEVVVTMKLGELLVSAGKLTPAQVEETLKGQAIFGGRFGTNLVEMGYLDEHDLAHFLSKKAGVPHAAPEQLMDIPPQVIRIIPEHVVRKYRVVPIALNNRKLILAMTDPSDFSAIDEISFQTGYIVVPMIVPELRLVTAMEKHYNIRRDLRYIKVEGGGRNRGRLVPPPPHLAPQAAPAPAPAAPKHEPPVIELEEDILELPLLSELGCFGEMETPQVMPVARATMEPAAQPAPVQPRPQEPEPVKELTADIVLMGLAQAEDRNRIGELVVRYTAQQFKRSAIFMLKGGVAAGWFAQVGKTPVPGFTALEIPLNEPSILRVVSESRTFYVGPMPITQGNSTMLSALGGGNPINNLLVPLMMMGRVVAILYVEGDTHRLDERVPELQKLMGKASMAFEILILKNKILSR
jgi:hypothetical protein